MKACRSKLAKTMLEDLKFTGLQGEELDVPLYNNGVTLVNTIFVTYKALCVNVFD